MADCFDTTVFSWVSEIKNGISDSGRKLEMSMSDVKMDEWKAKEGEWIERGNVVPVIETEKSGRLWNRVHHKVGNYPNNCRGE